VKIDDAELARILAEAPQKPGWARTKVAYDPNTALTIEVKAGQLLLTVAGDLAGIYEFESDGDWMLLPKQLWLRTLARLRAAEPRLTGRGDGGPRRH
jgi:hypothetical protein